MFCEFRFGHLWSFLRIPSVYLLKSCFCTNNFTLHGNESNSTAIFDMFEEGIFFFNFHVGTELRVYKSTYLYHICIFSFITSFYETHIMKYPCTCKSSHAAGTEKVTSCQTVSFCEAQSILRQKSVQENRPCTCSMKRGGNHLSKLIEEKYSLFPVP